MLNSPKLEAMMDRILILDETYNYGAIHALMGAYYASIPESLGGKFRGRTVSL